MGATGSSCAARVGILVAPSEAGTTVTAGDLVQRVASFTTLLPLSPVFSQAGETDLNLACQAAGDSPATR